MFYCLANLLISITLLCVAISKFYSGRWKKIMKQPILKPVSFICNKFSYNCQETTALLHKHDPDEISLILKYTGGYTLADNSRCMFKIANSHFFLSVQALQINLLFSSRISRSVYIDRQNCRSLPLNLCCDFT